ncbi:MAG: tRNA (adenosine(37)-N6)-threonylcarbamoyltransferase complex dimerization subunit type 1 TsaB [Bryobacteraceae bacterium]
MNRILALDTTNEYGSLALAGDGQVVAEVLLHSQEGFSGILFDQLRGLLERGGWRLEDIDCFAAAAGPGSFTGVRVGLAAVKGLAEALGKRVVAVSNLEAVAWFGGAALRAAVVDARRGQIYGAVYTAELGIASPEVVMPFPAWLATLPEGGVEFVCQDFAPFRPALEGTRFEHSMVREAPRALAGAIAKIAAARLAAGLSRSPAEIDANYVRQSDAELFWSE